MVQVGNRRAGYNKNYLIVILLLVIFLNFNTIYTLKLRVLDHDDASTTSSRPFDGYGLGIPPDGQAENLPSLEATTEEKEKVNKLRNYNNYGGEDDKTHLGGFTEVDPEGISPALWKEMMSYFGVKSMLDVGCGRGFSTLWFHLQGVKAQCVEGSKDALKQNLLRKVVAEEGEDPDEYVVEHDFTRGPWWPEKTVDAVWAIEFLEHISRNYQKNYLATFKKAAFIFATHSRWGGWHHTEVHEPEWWINRMEMYGFKYSETLSKKGKGIVGEERSEKIPFPSGGVYHGDRIQSTLMVFINPAVASLEEHAHLLGEAGCYQDKIGDLQCGEERNPRARAINSPLPDEFKPIPYSEKKHKEWEEIVKANVATKDTKKD